VLQKHFHCVFRFSYLHFHDTDPHLLQSDSGFICVSNVLISASEFLKIALMKNGHLDTKSHMLAEPAAFGLRCLAISICRGSCTFRAAHNMSFVEALALSELPITHYPVDTLARSELPITSAQVLFGGLFARSTRLVAHLHFRS
jgi:hypothetical protein